MSKLVIVESPAKCKKIEGFLGSGYKCIASFGHIRNLNDGIKGIDVKNDFKPTFKMLPSKNKYIKPLRAAIKKADEIILATDDDREGEAIAWHICKAFNLPLNTTKRIIFHEITKSAIQHAIKNPTLVNIDKVNAQQARQILDCLVGFTISPILWQNISKKGGLSAGRCQTPALRIVYDNQQKINAAPGKIAYDTTAYFTDKNLDFKLDHHHTNKIEMGDFLEQSIEWAHNYSYAAPVNKHKVPPQPLTTSGLQQKASNVLHYSPKRTMIIAQQLYEQGYITYMRTDCKTYSKEFVDETKKFIGNKWGDNYANDNIYTLTRQKSTRKNNAVSKNAVSKNAVNKNAVNKNAANNNVIQEAHEAIRPTKISREQLLANTDAAQKQLYNLIWTTTIESCMAPAEYKLLCARITGPDQRTYKHSQELITFPGWLIVKGYEKINPLYNYMLTLSSPLHSCPVSYNKILSKMVLKDLKTHYTEARLVQQMEKVGIGRPSTFSSLVAKIQERGYVKKGDIKGRSLKCIDFDLNGETLDEIETSRIFGHEKNKLIIEPTGIIVIEFLIKHFDSLFVYPYTKNMEDALDEISNGAKLWHSLCHSCYDEIKRLSSKIKKNNKETIKIDDNHVYMIAKYGPVVKYENDGKTIFKSAKKDLDMDKLKNGEYTLDDILLPTTEFSGKRLGSYKNADVILKKGRFGLYMVCNSKNYSLKGLTKNESNIKLEDVLDILMNKKSSNSKVLLIINKTMSVRKGKYGPYIFYKTETMTKPRFLNVKGLNWRTMGNGEIMNWCREVHGI